MPYEIKLATYCNMRFETREEAEAELFNVLKTTFWAVPVLIRLDVTIKQVKP